MIVLICNKRFPATFSGLNKCVTKQNFSSGQYVNAGDLLYIIDHLVYENEVNQAKANLHSAEASLDYYENNYNRMLEASKSDAISQIDLIQAETNVRTAQAW